MKSSGRQRAIRRPPFASTSSTLEPNAAMVASGIVQAVELLQFTPEMGRPGRVLGTRELVVPDTLHLPYRLRRDHLEAVFYSRQKWVVFCNGSALLVEARPCASVLGSALRIHPLEALKDPPMEWGREFCGLS